MRTMSFHDYNSAYAENLYNLQPFIETVTNKILETERLFEKIRDNKQDNDKSNLKMNLISSLLDTIPVPIFAKDEKLNFIECNKAFQKFIGLERREIIGKNCSDIFPDCIGSFLQKKFEDVFITKVRIDFEHTIHINGHDIDVNISINPLFDENGRLYGVVGIFNDITSFKSNEKTG